MALSPNLDVMDFARETDGALACLASAGARRAEAELCARFAPRVRSYGRRHLRSEDEAGELVQRVLVVLVEKLRAGAVREPERIASFVLGSARITALAMRRQGAREQPADQTLEPAGPVEAERDIMASGHLARCFERLGDRERDTLLGTYYGQQSSDQLAQALRVSADNVRQIRRRAMSQLRDCLGIELEGGT